MLVTAPLPSRVHEFLLATMGCPVIQGYGMTENSANATLANLADLRAGHVGKVRIQLPGARSLISWLGEQPPVLDVHVETALVVFGLPTKREWGAEQYAQEAAAKETAANTALALGAGVAGLVTKMSRKIDLHEVLAEKKI